MVFLRPTIVRDGATMNAISHGKYNYMRAQQLMRQSEGVPLMPNERGPIMPEWDDALTLPPTYDQYLLEKEKAEQSKDD